MSIYKDGRYKELDPFEKSEVKEIPDKIGTYRVLVKSGPDSLREILYIGVSNNLKRRIKEHVKLGKKIKDGEIVSYKVAKSGIDYDEVYEHEKEKIKKHKPERNKSKGGEGRKPKFNIVYDND